MSFGENLKNVSAILGVNMAEYQFARAGRAVIHRQRQAALHIIAVAVRIAAI